MDAKSQKSKTLQGRQLAGRTSGFHLEEGSRKYYQFSLIEVAYGSVEMN